MLPSPPFSSDQPIVTLDHGILSAFHRFEPKQPSLEYLIHFYNNNMDQILLRASTVEMQQQVNMGLISEIRNMNGIKTEMAEEEGFGPQNYFFGPQGPPTNDYQVLAHEDQHHNDDQIRLWNQMIRMMEKPKEEEMDGPEWAGNGQANGQGHLDESPPDQTPQLERMDPQMHQESDEYYNLDVGNTTPDLTHHPDNAALQGHLKSGTPVQTQQALQFERMDSQMHQELDEYHSLGADHTMPDLTQPPENVTTQKAPQFERTDSEMQQESAEYYNLDAGNTSPDLTHLESAAIQVHMEKGPLAQIQQAPQYEGMDSQMHQELDEYHSPGAGNTMPELIYPENAAVQKHRKSDKSGASSIRLEKNGQQGWPENSAGTGDAISHSKRKIARPKAINPQGQKRKRVQNQIHQKSKPKEDSDHLVTLNVQDYPTEGPSGSFHFVQCITFSQSPPVEIQPRPSGTTKPSNEKEKLVEIQPRPTGTAKPQSEMEKEKEKEYNKAVEHAKKCKLYKNWRLYNTKQFFIFDPDSSADQFPQIVASRHPTCWLLFQKRCNMLGVNFEEAGKLWNSLQRIERDEWANLADKMKVEREIQFEKGYIRYE